MLPSRGIVVAGWITVVVVLALVFWPRAELTPRSTQADFDVDTASAQRVVGPPPAIAVAAAPERREAPPTSAGTEARDNLEDRLRIVNENGAPLPGAEYFYGSLPCSSMAGLLESEALRELWHPDTWLAQHCERQVADDGGYVTGRSTDTPHVNMARHGGRIAFRNWPFENELRFEPDRTCTITVVDAAGKPIAGAAVALRREREPASDSEPIVGVTDAHGVCIASHLQRFHPDAFDLGYLPRFGVRGLGLRGADVPFDPASPPAQVTLTLPPCGRVAVELLDTNGARLASPDPILLLAPDGEQLAEYTRATGPIEFGLCAVGLQLAVTTPENHRFAGPRADGEDLVETLRLTDIDAGSYVLIGRALDAHGTPIANGKLFTKSDLHDLGQETTTTAMGRFVFLYAADNARHLTGDDGLGFVQCEWREGRGLVDHRGVFLRLARPLRPGIVDVGDVVLQDAVVLVRGRVRDAAGAALDAFIGTTYYGGGLEVVRQTEGRFEVRGLANRGQVVLEVSAVQHAEAQIVTAVPCPDLDIVLEPQGAGEVGILVDEPMLPHRKLLLCDLVDASGNRHRGTVGDTLLSQSGGTEGIGCRCTWRVRPGAYRCEIRLLHESEPVAIVTDVVVDKGDAPAGSPPVIDLRGRLQTVRLTWIDEAGEAVSLDAPSIHAPGTATAVDGVAACNAQRGDETGCWLLGTGAPIAITVESSEFCGTWSGPFANANVTVQPLPVTAFRIPGLPPTPAPSEWEVRAIARSGDAQLRLRREDWRGVGQQDLGYGRLGLDYGAVDREGRGTLHLAPGTRYAFELMFLRGDTRMRCWHVVDRVPGTIDLGATLPQELTFRFDPQQMQEAIR